jgi:hypothetical protein
VFLLALLTARCIGDNIKLDDPDFWKKVGLKDKAEEEMLAPSQKRNRGPANYTSKVCHFYTRRDSRREADAVIMLCYTVCRKSLMMARLMTKTQSRTLEPSKHMYIHSHTYASNNGQPRINAG